MKLNKDDVEYTSKLAKLALDDSETEKLAQDMGAILDYFQLLNEVDITGVEPLTHILESENVTRKDEVGETMNIDDALANAEDSQDRFFKLPKML